jgi:hypothetical protein
MPGRGLRAWLPAALWTFPGRARSGADAAFAMPDLYEFLEAKRIKYAIRLPANQVLQTNNGTKFMKQWKTKFMKQWKKRKRKRKWQNEHRN